MDAQSYVLDDGRMIEVCVELGQWSVRLKDDARSQIVGFPLEGVLMELVGLNPAHDDVPPSIERLADRVRSVVPRETWPSGPLTA
jgi:hypothetical protein